MSFGHPYIVKTTGCIHDGWLVLSCLRKDVDQDYFYHLLGSPTTYSEFKRRAAGATVKNLNIDLVKGVEVRLPPLAEQQRIAALLGQADELRWKQIATLELVETISRSIFFEMFGDPVVNSMDWPLKTLGDIGELERGISKHRPRNEPSLLGGAYPLIQTGDVANCDGYISRFTSTYSEVGLRQSKMWPRGTLCITIAANIGKTGILEFDSCFPDSIVGFTPNDLVLTEYVQTWMSFIQRKLEDEAPQFAQKNINLGILRSLTIPLPPMKL